MPCTTDKYVGREVILEVFISCGETMPTESDWKLIGAGRTKSFTGTWDTVDATADDTNGNVRTNLATWLALEISADGVLRRADTADTILVALTKHFFNPVATGGQPIVMARLTYPDITFISAMLMSECSREAPFDDMATWAITMSATDSVVGLVVQDTPVVPDPT